jgi:hypothetical protein
VNADTEPQVAAGRWNVEREGRSCPDSRIDERAFTDLFGQGARVGVRQPFLHLDISSWSAEDSLVILVRRLLAMR